MKSPSRISRRTALRGLGVSLALPLLEAMDVRPLRAEPTGPKSPPLRLAFVYVPNGVHMADWTPRSLGVNFALSPILEPLRSTSG